MFFFPLKILFIDDNLDLLSSYQYINIPNEIETESNPLKAYNNLTKDKLRKIDVFTDITEIIDLDTQSDRNDTVLQFSFDNFIKSIETKNKGYGIAVIDCKMPLLDGIELCEKLDSKINIIKILLTGEFKPLEALNAINDGKADHYIPKGTPTTLDDLISAINNLQMKYFLSTTKNYLDIFEDKFPFLFDNEYSTLFNQLLSKHNIIEFYLISNAATFVLKSDKSEYYILNSFTENELNDFCESHNYLDNVIISKIQNKELIPNFKIPYKCNIHDFTYPALKHGKYYYNMHKVNDIKKLKGD